MCTRFFLFILTVGSFLTCISSSSSYAQQLRAGRLFGTMEETSVSLQLLPDSTFAFFRTDGKLERRARGEWKSTSDSLHLVFVAPFFPDLPTWEMVSSTPSNSPTLYLTVIDLPTGNPIPGAQVYASPLHDKLGTISDRNGLATLAFQEFRDVVEIGIRFIGYSEFRVPFILETDVDVQAVARIVPSSNEYWNVCSAHGGCTPPPKGKEKWGFKIERYGSAQIRLVSENMIWEMKY